MTKAMSRTVRTTLVIVSALSILVYGWISFLGSPRTARAVSGVSGVVKSPTGTAIAEVVEVCFFGPTGGACGNTQNDGTFNISVNPGRYRAEARPTPASSFAPSAERDVEVFADQTTSGFELRLSTLQMKGQLKKPDGSGTHGVVNVHSQDFSQFAHANADDSGNYKLGGLAAGTYIAEAMPPFEASGLTSPEPATVTLGGAVVTQNFTFVAAVKKITGKVIRSSGAAVSNANVNAFKMNGAGFANGQTDLSGNYTLSVSGGTWNVQTFPPPGADWVYDKQPSQVDFANDSTSETKTVDLEVTSASSKVKGTVRDEKGNLITAGNVDFRSSDGRGSGTQIAPTGTYEVSLPGGTYNVFIWTQSNAYSLPPTMVSLNENETKTLDLTVKTKNARIKGSVKTAAGTAASNVEVNANQNTGPGGGPGSFTNSRTDVNGNYELAVTAGTWNVHVGFNPQANFVPVNQRPLDVVVPTDTSVITAADYPDLNFTVVQADVKITGRVLDSSTNQPVTNFFGCAFARPVGSFGESCSPIQNGTFTILVSSSVSTTFEIGAHTPPNSEYSGSTPERVTVTAGATVNKDILLLKNNSAIVGKLIDPSGFPITKFEARGMVFADGVSGHYFGEIQSDGTYRISLVAGNYNIGSFFDPQAGFLNAPPDPKPVQVFSGQEVTKNIVATQGDAEIKGKLIDPDGRGVMGFIMANTTEEIRDSKEFKREERKGEGTDLGFGKKMPCGATDIAGVIKCCSDSKNQKVCEAFKVPEGPNGCDNAWTCVQQCKKSPEICKEAQREGEHVGPVPGEDFSGPGGCKSEAECQKYCSDPAHFKECSEFKPPAGGLSVKVSTRGVRATAEGPKGPGGPAGFDQAIHAGGPTDPQGNFSFKVLSGHKYQVCAGLPPESNAMPPKCVNVDLRTAKSAFVTLQLRKADATVEGKVTIGKNPAGRCFVHAWAEDGGFSGTPCNPGGQYKLNISKGAAWHIGSDSFDGSDFYRAEEATIVVEGDKKKYKQDFALKKSTFEVPEPVSASFDCTSPTTVSLKNGTKIEIPAGAISSNSGTCSFTATPTIDLQRMKGSQPFGVGYKLEARDENGQTVTKLKSNATVTLEYDEDDIAEAGVDESALQPAFFDSTTGSYENLTTCTQDTENKKFSCPVDHFSAYAIVNQSGVSSKNAALKNVTLSTTKAGLTKFTVGKKSVTPFKCKGDVSVKTTGVKGKQLIVAGATCDPTVKVYSDTGKLVKKLTTGFRGTGSLAMDDFTKDGNADIAVGSANGTPLVKIYEPASKKPKYKSRTVQVGFGTTTKTLVASIETSVKGTNQIVAGVADRSGKIGSFQVMKFKKGKFTQDRSFKTSTLKASGNTIVFTPAKPKVKSVSPKSVSSSGTSKLVKVTLKGTNFTGDTTAVICGNVGTVFSRINSKKAVIVFDAAELTPGKCSITLTNPDGGTTTSKKILTVK